MAGVLVLGFDVLTLRRGARPGASGGNLALNNNSSYFAQSPIRHRG